MFKGPGKHRKGTPYRFERNGRWVTMPDEMDYGTAKRSVDLSPSVTTSVQHLAASYNGSTMQWYFDGLPFGQAG